MRFNLIKRQPSYFFENMHQDLERFLHDTFGTENMSMKAPMEGTFRPAVEIIENSKEYKIDVELAGVKKEDISVELCDNSISISAETKFEKKEDKDNVHTSEFRYGKFCRQLHLENGIKTDEAKSEFKDGILHIILPKKEEIIKESTKKLEIK